jgi:hypothetical protein
VDIAALAEALERSGLAQAMRHSLWLYPAVEIVHIVGIVLLVGSIAMLDLRLVGFSRETPVRQLARHVLPWTWTGLAIVVPTGLAMFSTHATEFLDNPALRLKLVLIAAAGINALAFHLGAFRSVAAWDARAAVPAGARRAAVVSLVIWLAVIACGRLIAYL